MKLVCGDCRRLWNYRGERTQGYASCPDCGGAVPIQQDARDIFRNDLIVDASNPDGVEAHILAKKQEGRGGRVKEPPLLWCVESEADLGVRLTRILCKVGRAMMVPSERSDLSTTTYTEVATTHVNPDADEPMHPTSSFHLTHPDDTQEADA